MNETVNSLPPDKRALLLRRVIEKARGRSDSPLRVQHSPFFATDRRPLLSLFATGQLEPVDAAAFGTLSDVLLNTLEGLSPRQITHEICHDLPVFATVRTLPHGRIASFIVPRFYSQIYDDPDDLVRLVTQCLQTAKFVGARTASLTGLLASATDYGRALAPEAGLPAVTTGHATTAAAVVLSVRDLLGIAGRSIAQETVGFVGLGSVGSAVLRLILDVLPHPKRLILCDLYQKQPAIDRQVAILRDHCGYRGPVDFFPSRAGVDDALYDSSLIVGATNVPEVIDVGKLCPGTLIVDDSDPHSFDVGRAITRLERHHDILFTEGGALQSPATIDRLMYLPELLADAMEVTSAAENARTITGCVLSSLLSATQDYPLTLGPVRPQDAQAHYHGLVADGYGAAHPHCNSYLVSASAVEKFRSRHGCFTMGPVR
jgi:predicted amino acid dehydrogenase